MEDSIKANLKDNYYSAIKKERSASTCYHMNEPWHYPKWRKPDTEGHMYGSIYVKCPK